MNLYRWIIAGFSNDLETIVSGVSRSDRCFLVDENTEDVTELPPVEMIVYVVSSETSFSSQLLSWFTWLHDNAGKAEEFVAFIEDENSDKNVFDSIKNIPVLTTDLLLVKLNSS